MHLVNGPLLAIRLRYDYDVYDEKLTSSFFARIESRRMEAGAIRGSRIVVVAKENLTQNGHSVSFKVTCFEESGKAIRD